MGASKAMLMLVDAIRSHAFTGSDRPRARDNSEALIMAKAKNVCLRSLCRMLAWNCQSLLLRRNRIEIVPIGAHGLLLRKCFATN